MKWFKQWFSNACREAWEDSKPEAVPVSKTAMIGSRGGEWHENLNIAITTATGGKIVTFRRYDHRTDRHDNRIYVIPDDHDFNVELGKLITLESMRG